MLSSSLLPTPDCLARLLPLTALRVGEVATVVQVVGDSRCVHHLHEVGLRVGAEVEMLRAGSPCIVRVDGQRLCLRADELSSMMVTLQDATS